MVAEAQNEGDLRQWAGRVDDLTLSAGGADFFAAMLAHRLGPEVVLRFHWMESLRCRPGCKVERFVDPADRVGFIRIPNPPPRFEIYNQY